MRNTFFIYGRKLLLFPHPNSTINDRLYTFCKHVLSLWYHVKVEYITYTRRCCRVSQIKSIQENLSSALVFYRTIIAFFCVLVCFHWSSLAQISSFLVRISMECHHHQQTSLLDAAGLPFQYFCTYLT